MINLTDEDKLKIALLDRLFSSVDYKYLEGISESEQIIARLSGTEQSSCLLAKLINENILMSDDLNSAKSEIIALRADVQILVKLVLKPFEYNSQGEANILKSKYNIY